jgi:hypothetical protein
MKNPNQAAITIFLIILTGFVLFTFNEPVNEFREMTITATSGYDNVILNTILYLLLPIIWIIYILSSIWFASVNL